MRLREAPVITTILAIATVLCLLMFVRTLRSPPFPSRTALLLTFLFAALWSLDALGQYLAPTPEVLLFFAYVTPIPIASTFWFGISFILIQSGNLRSERLPAIAAFVTVWVTGLVLFHQLDALRPWLLATSYVEMVGGRPFWHWTPGPVFRAVATVNIIVYGAMLALVTRAILRATSVHRLHLVGILIGSLMPMGVNLGMLFFDLQLDGIDPTPLTLLPSCLLYYWLTAHRHLATLSPVPRHLLMDAIPDPILVLRDGDVVVEANKAAAGLGGLPGEPIGCRLGAYGQFAPVLGLETAGPATDVRLDVSGEAQPRIFAVEATPYKQVHGGGGTMLIFRDVTDRTALEMQVLAMIEELQGQLAANVELQNRLREQAIRDPLTGLFNRHHCADVSAGLVRDALGNGQRFAAVLVDLDHFKSVNDDLGHPVGDLVLRTAAEVLHRVVGTGWAFRYGGEEFLMLLPGTSAVEAVAVADRCRSELAAATSGNAAIGRPVTLSAGVAVFPDDARDWARLMQRTDAALYKAKARGRNRVQTWSPSLGEEVGQPFAPALQVGRKA
jgi:diguanylate cyclase (GGDEF)-like protein